MTNRLLTELLRDVSRSFYLTLRVLPRPVRSQIGLAYLLARATDTVADTDIVPVAERLAALDLLRRRILAESSAPLTFERFRPKSGLATEPHSLAPDSEAAARTTLRHRAETAEHALLGRLEEALALLRQFAPVDQESIRDVLETITSGQELDLKRFATADANRIVALKDDSELDDYTYRVAGCVGEFWTKICRRHLFPEAAIDESRFLADGVRFGQGLQLVNILRDLPRDLRIGRCYLPLDRLQSAGLTPSDLLTIENESRLRPLYDEYLGRAEAHLRAGWDYTNTVPFGQVRIRLPCAWPIQIGMRTLARLRRGKVLDSEHRIKVGRGEIWSLILRSVFTYPFPGLWRKA